MRFQLFTKLGVSVLVAMTGVAGATDLELQQITFPERNQIDVTFDRNFGSDHLF